MIGSIRPLHRKLILALCVCATSLILADEKEEGMINSEDGRTNGHAAFHHHPRGRSGLGAFFVHIRECLMNDRTDVQITIAVHA